MKLKSYKGRWVEDLPEILWSYHTTARQSTGETPFNLAFGSAAVILTEIGMPTLCVETFDERGNNGALLLNLNLLEEKRAQSQLCLVEYQNHVARYYNAKVKTLGVQG